MKRIIFALLLLSFAGLSQAHAQIRKIPAAVTDAFKEKYPDAEKVEWHDKLTAFEARFEIGGIYHEARFNSKGEWQQTEKAIQDDDLPGDVQDGLKKSKYAEWEIKSIYEIYLPGDEKKYRLYAEKSDLKKKNLLFNSDGRLLKEKITL
ncbi:MAG: PepSY-like domain-containing protein [Chitinophagaceae bacterium]|nr:PepSY-like domain-containing protein [Chitinophagaceae bacterium]